MRRTKQRARRSEKRLGLESLEDRRLLTVVTSADDAGAGTLRDVAASNDGTITFALPSGTDTIALSSGEILIPSSVSIDGNDPVNGNITVDANGTSRVFYIDDSLATYADVSISNLTITGGYSIDGGGIQSFEDLTLDNVIVTGNSVGGGGDAGGIGHGNETRSAGDLLITNSQISNNRADDDGSAIDHYNGGNFTLIDSEVSGNASGIPGAGAIAGGIVGAIRVIDIDGVSSPATHALFDNVLMDANSFEGDASVGYAVGLGPLFVYNTSSVPLTMEFTNSTITGTQNNIIPDPAELNDGEVQGGGINLRDVSSATISDSEFTNSDVNSGGGLFISTVNYASDVTLNNVLISGNTTTSLGLAYVDPTDPSYFPPGGAGLFVNGGNQLVDLTVTVNDSAITGNSSEGVGGGIYLYRAQLTLNNTTVSGNTAGTKGGAIFMNGGLYNYPNPSDGGLYLNYSTITNNSADTGGGAYLSGYYGSYGYGNYQQSYLSLNHTIISGNQAATAGADIYDYDANNASSPGCPCDRVKVANFSIVGDNSTTMLTAANPVPDANGNLIGEPGNLVDAMLAPLADNGGMTLTHALMSGSPALNAGDPDAMAGVGGVPEFDQRGVGFSRVIDGRIDIGAFEGEVTNGPTGDFNGDGLWDCLDIDALTAEVAAGTNNPTFDLTSDGLVNMDDIVEWLEIAGGINLMSGNSYAIGDATLDGTVDGLDFIEWNNNKFTANTAWCGGNFNGDGVTDGLDFIDWNTNKFTQQGPIIQGPEKPQTVDVAGGHLVAEVVPSSQRLAANSDRAVFQVVQTSTEVRRTADQVERPSLVLDQVFAEFGT